MVVLFPLGVWGDESMRTFDEYSTLVNLERRWEGWAIVPDLVPYRWYTSTG